MRRIDLPVAAVLAADTLLGEGVVWDPGRRIVWFTDIKRRRLWHFDPETGASGFAEAPEQIGWALPAEDGLLLCGLKDGLHIFAPDSGTFTRLCTIPGEPAGNRLNDACTDPWGRVWFGSMDDGEGAGGAATGRFYVFDKGEVRAAGPAGIAITNGPAVNAAGTRIYFTDTARKRVLVADLSPEGLGEARLFADTAALMPGAFPDGPVVDAEDHVWMGMYLGGCAARFAPDGGLVATVPIPARDITKLAFGGADLATAYVTSATQHMDAADMARDPEAGSLFAFRSPVAGFAQTPARLA